MATTFEVGIRDRLNKLGTLLLLGSTLTSGVPAETIAAKAIRWIDSDSSFSQLRVYEAIRDLIVYIANNASKYGYDLNDGFRVAGFTSVELGVYDEVTSARLQVHDKAISIPLFWATDKATDTTVPITHSPFPIFCELPCENRSAKLIISGFRRKLNCSYMYSLTHENEIGHTVQRLHQALAHVNGAPTYGHSKVGDDVAKLRVDYNRWVAHCKQHIRLVIEGHLLLHAPASFTPHKEDLEKHVDGIFYMHVLSGCNYLANFPDSEVLDLADVDADRLRSIMPTTTPLKEVAARALQGAVPAKRLLNRLPSALHVGVTQVPVEMLTDYDLKEYLTDLEQYKKSLLEKTPEKIDDVRERTSALKELMKADPVGTVAPALEAPHPTQGLDVNPLLKPLVDIVTKASRWVLANTHDPAEREAKEKIHADDLAYILTPPTYVAGNSVSVLWQNFSIWNAYRFRVQRMVMNARRELNGQTPIHQEATYPAVEDMLTRAIYFGSPLNFSTLELSTAKFVDEDHVTLGVGYFRSIAPPAISVEDLLADKSNLKAKVVGFKKLVIDWVPMPKFDIGDTEIQAWLDARSGVKKLPIADAIPTEASTPPDSVVSVLQATEQLPNATLSETRHVSVAYSIGGDAPMTTPGANLEVPVPVLPAVNLINASAAKKLKGATVEESEKILRQLRADLKFLTTPPEYSVGGTVENLRADYERWRLYRFRFQRLVLNAHLELQGVAPVPMNTVFNAVEVMLHDAIFQGKALDFSAVPSLTDYSVPAFAVEYLRSIVPPAIKVSDLNEESALMSILGTLARGIKAKIDIAGLVTDWIPMPVFYKVSDNEIQMYLFEQQRVLAEIAQGNFIGLEGTSETISDAVDEAYDNARKAAVDDAQKNAEAKAMSETPPTTGATARSRLEAIKGRTISYPAFSTVIDGAIHLGGRAITDGQMIREIKLADGSRIGYQDTRFIKRTFRDILRTYLGGILSSDVMDHAELFLALGSVLREVLTAAGYVLSADTVIDSEVETTLRRVLVEVERHIESAAPPMVTDVVASTEVGKDAQDPTLTARVGRATLTLHRAYALYQHTLPSFVFHQIVKELEGTHKLESLKNGIEVAGRLQAALAGSRQVRRMTVPLDLHALRIEIVKSYTGDPGHLQVGGPTLPDRATLSDITKLFIQCFTFGHLRNSTFEMYMLASLITSLTDVSISLRGELVGYLDAQLVGHITKCASSFIENNSVIERVESVQLSGVPGSQPKAVAEDGDEDAEDGDEDAEDVDDDDIDDEADGMDAAEVSRKISPEVSNWLINHVCRSITDEMFQHPSFAAVLAAAQKQCQTNLTVYAEKYIRDHYIQKVRSHILRAVIPACQDGFNYKLVAENILHSLRRSSTCSPDGLHIAGDAINDTKIQQGLEQVRAAVEGRPYAFDGPKAFMHLTEYVEALKGEMTPSSHYAKSPSRHSQFSQVGIRMASRQVMRVSRDALITLVATKFNVSPELATMFLSSQAGEGLIEFIVGTLLGYAPIEGEMPRRVAAELRISGLTDIGSEIADVLIEPIKKILADAVTAEEKQAPPPAPAALPNATSTPASSIFSGQRTPEKA